MRDLIRTILREEFIVEGRKPKTTEDFISDAIKVHGDEYTYDKVDYKNNRSDVIITCPVHGDFSINANDFLKGRGCPKWIEHGRFKPKSNTVEFIEKAKKVWKDKYTYDNVNYQGSKKKVMITCPIHKEDFPANPDDFLRGRGCKKCSESKGERYVSELLNNFGIEFISDKKFEGCVGLPKGGKCYPLKFDFYLPEYNMAIEFDGEQHFTSIHSFNRNIGESELYDKIKNDYCKDNNIKLIRIPYKYPLPTNPPFNHYDDLSSYKGGGNKKYPYIEPYLRDVLGIS
jgi:hypothetical protein